MVTQGQLEFPSGHPDTKKLGLFRGYPGLLQQIFISETLDIMSYYTQLPRLDHKGHHVPAPYGKDVDDGLYPCLCPYVDADPYASLVNCDHFP
jgi:hypothetical protein